MATAQPFYSAYINNDCQISSPLSPDYRELSDSCQQINALIDAINVPYTGSSNGERLTWLKTRQALLIRRAAVIAQALKDLGDTDTVNHTATSIRSVSGLAAGLVSLVPAVGPIIGVSLGIVGQVVGGLIDTTKGDTERKVEEITAYKADYAGLVTILDQTNQEIDKLNIVNYLLYGSLLVLLLIYFFKKKN